jgi:hypothetical protein
VDVVLVFLPLQWQTTDWVLTTIVQAFGGLPILAVGLGAVTASVAALGPAGAARRLAAVHVLVVLSIAALVIAFPPAATTAMQTIPGGIGSGLGRAAVRTYAYGAIFAVLHLLLAAVCWRAGRPAAPRPA